MVTGTITPSSSYGLGQVVDLFRNAVVLSSIYMKFICVAALFTLTAALSRDSYEDLSNDFSCARRNQALQKEKFPDWSFGRIAASTSKEPIQSAWEPILEPVPHCNNLRAGWTKDFEFLVVLDASWVRYYRENKILFSAQGYNSLMESPNMLLHRVSYLFRKQFGATISAGRIVPLKDLGEACDTNKGDVDDGTMRTSTSKQLRKAGVAPLRTDAAIMRLGVGSFSGVHCDSYAPDPSFCKHKQIFASQWHPFTKDGSGRMDYEATQTLAHELAHVFGVCPKKNDHCLNFHSVNGLADIQVWDGTPSVKARPQGMFLKFMTACTPLYRDTVCKNIQSAPASCGKIMPPPTIAGEYVSDRFSNRREATPEDFVTIRSLDRGVRFSWMDGAGNSFKLTRKPKDAYLFGVSTKSAANNKRFKRTRVQTMTMDNGTEKVIGIYGPGRILYTLKSPEIH